MDYFVFPIKYHYLDAPFPLNNTVFNGFGIRLTYFPIFLVLTGIDKVVNGYDDLKEGDIIRGYVKACTKVGVFVRYVCRKLRL